MLHLEYAYAIAKAMDQSGWDVIHFAYLYALADKRIRNAILRDGACQIVAAYA